jgi:hypothetical protein
MTAIPNLKFFATDLHRLSQIFKPKSAPIREIIGLFFASDRAAVNRRAIHARL